MILRRILQYVDLSLPRFIFSGKIFTCDDNDSDNVFIHLIKKHIKCYKVELAGIFNRHLQYQKLTKSAKLKSLNRQEIEKSTLLIFI